ncbi:MAG: ribulose-phosphate 3-epimerase [Bacteroidales bacterium]|nr:ribulose-phosphate 3-epimerase [Bacteroidales bacterium]
MGHLLSPSILNADFGKLDEEIKMLNESKADWIHLDIMDGVFVPNISFGFPVIEAVKKAATKPLDVHLMIVNPDQYIERYKAVGANWLTVHYEACTHLHRTVQNIKSQGMKAGVSLNPHSPVSLLYDIIEDVDMVLIMTVNPGFGGQSFIPNSYNKIRDLKEMILKKNSKALIEIDGGVDLGNMGGLRDAGVDVFVVGSFIFRDSEPIKLIEKLKAV